MGHASDFGPSGIMISEPDEHGNRFITVLGDDGRPLPAHEPSNHDREGA